MVTQDGENVSRLISDLTHDLRPVRRIEPHGSAP